jgi:protein tyrosine phosphatase (PTP) superfamily phosphohydrolase (DUF442 family)
MSTREIYNAIQVSDRLTTAGQPTEAQLRDAAAEGFTAVINLVGHYTSNPLPGEAELIGELGLTYVLIPVDWGAPTDADFDAFDEAMNRLAGGKLLIHCAANYRVTAFYSLYAQKHLGWTAEQAEAFRQPIWAGSDYPVWESFIARKQAEIRSAGPA